MREKTVSEIPLWEHGLTFHQLALTISGASSILAIATSGYLITMHALHYTQPEEQRKYVRPRLLEWRSPRRRRD